MDWLEEKKFTPKKIADICNSKRSKNGSLIFAIIVYDLRNPAVVKVLNDKNYWNALDIISGKILSIFCIDYRQDSKQLGDDDITDSKSIEKASSLIRENFIIGRDIKTPFVSFFQIDGESNIKSFAVELKKEKVEDAFLELKDLIQNVVDSLGELRLKDHENYQEIFNIVKNGISTSESNSLSLDKITKTISSFIKLVLLYNSVTE